jgi:hypothetical protein
MKKMITVLLFAGLVFGASAGGAWYMQKQKAAADAAAANPDDLDVSQIPPGHTSGDATKSGKSSGLAGHGVEKKADHGEEASTAESGLPSAVRPQPVSVEELLKYSLGLKSREERIVEREKELERKQSQASIVLADIEGEQRELDGLRAQVKGELGSVERILGQIAEERQKIDADRVKSDSDLKELRNSQESAKTSEAENVKIMSTWFQQMEPEKAASIINDMAKDGKIDMAVQMLSNFEDRDAAKILSAIEDPTLTVELAEAFRNYKKPEKKDPKKR